MTGIFSAAFEDPEIAALLGDGAKAAAMVEVERALARVQGRLGVIASDIATAIDAGLRGFAPDLADLARGTASAGVPADRITAVGKGETEPMVATGDGVREPSNRRVVIRF